MLPRIWVTIDSVWIGNWIHWTLTERTYKNLRQSHWVTRSKYHCNYSTRKVLSDFPSRCSVAASNGRRSPSSGFPNDPRSQLPASHSNNSQRLTLSSSLIDWLTQSLTNQLTQYRSADSSQQTELLTNRPLDIVTYRPIARQRLGKHIPVGANARYNRASVAGQRRGKHASSTKYAVFCVVRTKGL
jgi:hypothetical protein